MTKRQTSYIESEVSSPRNVTGGCIFDVPLSLLIPIQVREANQAQRISRAIQEDLHRGISNVCMRIAPHGQIKNIYKLSASPLRTTSPTTPERYSVTRKSLAPALEALRILTRAQKQQMDRKKKEVTSFFLPTSSPKAKLPHGSSREFSRKLTLLLFSVRAAAENLSSLSTLPLTSRSEFHIAARKLFKELSRISPLRDRAVSRTGSKRTRHTTTSS